uniref:Uncharacterized protein n=1 Tax=Lotharella oceanica TaxID=641309 RepID=A0A7S2U0T5_9EUKA|mmetsp:Transcript_36548/g.67538  ORF Transcript_36548/g.67538 Transcript_36548/m.67538 type:complete len:453 (+) Transcript_36548:107-1465(+)
MLDNLRKMLRVFNIAFGGLVTFLNVFIILVAAAVKTGLWPHQILRSLFGWAPEVISSVFLKNDSEFSVRNWTVRGAFVGVLETTFPPWALGNSRKEDAYLPDLKDEMKNELDADGNLFIFVNGMMNARPIVEINRMILKKMFGRPINIFYNQPHSFIYDIIQCYVDKVDSVYTAPSHGLEELVIEILTKRNDVKKLIIFCHSQGSIITSACLRNLRKKVKKGKLDLKHIRDRLEVYSFATCTNSMRYIDDKTQCPYIEHYCNTKDYVSSLGVGAYPHIKRLCELRFDGRVYYRDRWGHFFNMHYLDNLRAYKTEGASADPRLFQYVKHFKINVPDARKHTKENPMINLFCPCISKSLHFWIDTITRIWFILPSAIILTFVAGVAFFWGAMSMILHFPALIWWLLLANEERLAFLNHEAGLQDKEILEHYKRRAAERETESKHYWTKYYAQLP